MTNGPHPDPYRTSIDVIHSRCTSPATFRHAFALTTASAWHAWQSVLWPSTVVTDWEGVHQWRPGEPAPSWAGWRVIQHDPALHAWKKPASGHQADARGVIRCDRSALRFTHKLQWPQDARYQITTRHGLLWAWNRAHALAIREHIAKTQRTRSEPTIGRLPSVSLRPQHRDDVLRAIDRMLEA